MNDATIVEVPEGISYHDIVPGISQSQIKLFLEDPGKFRDRYVMGEPEVVPEARRKAMQWGKDFERLIYTDEVPGILIPEEVLSRSERDGKVILSKRGAAWTEWKDRQIAEHGEDARLLRQDEWDREIAPLLIARDNLHRHEKAVKLLQGQRSVVLQWQDEITGMPCKCEIDCVSDWGVVTDLKTAQDATPEGFQKAVWNFGYFIQAYWYKRAWKRYTGEDRPFVFVVVQNKPSYSVETYDLDPKWYEMAHEKVTGAMERLARAYETNEWHTETFGKVTTLEPATWMTYRVGITK